MIKHAAITFGATFLAVGILIALPESVIAAHSAPAANDRAAQCDAVLVDALPELHDSYRDLCVRGYAIEGVGGRAVDAAVDACSETIMAELDVIAEGPSDAERAEFGLAPVPSPNYRTLIADCAELGSDAAYIKHVGPALPACTWEDGSDSTLPCFWDAATMGNHEGTSYIVVSAP
jgi:hypothetical protein